MRREVESEPPMTAIELGPESPCCQRRGVAARGEGEEESRGKESKRRGEKRRGGKRRGGKRRGRKGSGRRRREEGEENEDNNENDGNNDFNKNKWFKEILMEVKFVYLIPFLYYCLTNHSITPTHRSPGSGLLNGDGRFISSSSDSVLPIVQSLNHTHSPISLVGVVERGWQVCLRGC